MKFGKELRQTVDSSIPEWRPMFMSYKALKQLIERSPPTATGGVVNGSGHGGGGGGGSGGAANNVRLTGGARLRGAATRADGPVSAAGTVAAGELGVGAQAAFGRDRRFDGRGDDGEGGELLSRRPPETGRADRPLEDRRAGGGAVRRGGARHTAAAEE